MLAKAKVKALKNNELHVYDELEANKMNRQAIKTYLFGEDQLKKKDDVDLKERLRLIEVELFFNEGNRVKSDGNKGLHYRF